MKYKDIAEKHGVSLSAVKSWATRYWKKQGCNPATKKVATKKKGAPIGNKNATGPPGNKNAERHGFFAKWLPAETMEIMQCIERSNPIDLLWDNIQLQYAAIIRGQRLWYVKNQEDVTTTKIAESDSQFGGSEKWEVQQAWDKHSSFIQAQSRAMKTLESMIKQYDELTRSELVTEEQRARIDKLKADVAKINGEGKEVEDLTETDDVIYGKE
ncbi:MAG: hypothetical protein CVU92_04040 [Firmicutes bacterium HGW-Firmicutes-17]|nr:MAG: hypothetical protein CVU92_04040 [Firmicutes bacterium HGW-Firmicutes-17]